jgi:hypothetical protein
VAEMLASKPRQLIRAPPLQQEAATRGCPVRSRPFSRSPQ